MPSLHLCSLLSQEINDNRRMEYQEDREQGKNIIAQASTI